MNYLTAKESRVEKEWNKRGVAGLRSALLQKILDRDFEDWDDKTTVKQIANLVFGTLPRREWSKGEEYILETIQLVEVDGGKDFHTILMQAQLSEETLRDDIGDE